MTPRAAAIIAAAAEDAADELIASRGALLEQAHQIADPPVPPIGGARPLTPTELAAARSAS